MSPNMEPRVIRIFISSTFLDMHAEREELVKRIFPQLRKRCEDRGVSWGEVDLRWGITEEQKAEGKVLPYCLAEIQRCRPYFIGLLGERYGWVPEEMPREFIEQEPWLGDHVGHSVTELEILHGVLNNPKMADHSFFYFRDVAYLRKIPPERQRNFKEEPTQEDEARVGIEEARSRAADRRLKLLSLKERIRASGLPVRENYRDPVDLGELVQQDLGEVIDRLFPEDTKLDPLDQEASEHEGFAKTRAEIYIGRQEYFDRLDAHAVGDGPPLVVLGESGSGKSALLANWVLKYRDRHPEQFVFIHFIGASPYSSDWMAMLRRIMGEFGRREGIEAEIPEKPNDLKTAFSNWLHMASTKGKVVLVLDSLNKLEDRDGALDLIWLPNYIPASVRLIVSTLSGKPLDEITKRKWDQLRVDPLNKAERKELIKTYLRQYSKALTKDQEEMIAVSPQTANPLYLRAFLEEIRIYGDYATLARKASDYLQADTVNALFEKILHRYEEDYERDRSGLVRDAMSCLWAARRGLSESELMEILGTDGLPLPKAFWSPLYLASKDSLVSRSGLINFSHDYFRKAVVDYYLPANEDKISFHIRVANYFNNKDISNRKIEELPWQLAQAEKWVELKECVTDLEMFDKLYSGRNKYDLMDYWLKLKNQFNISKSYNEAITVFEQTNPPPAKLAYSLLQAGGFLYFCACYEDAEQFLRRASNLYETIYGPEHPELALSLNNLAALYDTQGKYEKAESLYRRAIDIIDRGSVKNNELLASSFSNIGLLMHKRGKYEEAESYYQRAINIFENIHGPDHISIANLLDLIASLYVSQEIISYFAENTIVGYFDGIEQINVYSPDKYSKAESLFRKSIIIKEKMFGLYHPDLASTLNNLGEVLIFQNKFEEAELLLKKALVILINTFGKHHPYVASSLSLLGKVYLGEKDFAKAISLFEQSIHLSENSIGFMHRRVVSMRNDLLKAQNLSQQYKAGVVVAKLATIVGKGNKEFDIFLSKKTKHINDVDVQESLVSKTKEYIFAHFMGTVFIFILPIVYYVTKFILYESFRIKSIVVIAITTYITSTIIALMIDAIRIIFKKRVLMNVEKVSTKHEYLSEGRINYQDDTSIITKENYDGISDKNLPSEALSKMKSISRGYKIIMFILAYIFVYFVFKYILNNVFTIKNPIIPAISAFIWMIFHLGIKHVRGRP